MMTVKRTFKNQLQTSEELLNNLDDLDDNQDTDKTEPEQTNKPVNNQKQEQIKKEIVRRKPDAERKTRRVDIMLTPAQYDKLKSAADKQGRTINGLLAYYIDFVLT